LILVALVLVPFALAESFSNDTSMCIKHKDCSSCLQIALCAWCNQDQTCLPQDGICADPVTHTCPPFFHWELIISSMLVFIAAALAAGAGIGGGALFVPILSLLFRISPSTAVPLSKVTILGVAVGGLLILMQKKHPSANRPLIDFNVALLMGPLVLAGTIIGVYFNIIFPPYVLVAFLVLLLGATVYKTYSKGFELMKKEKAAAENSETRPLFNSEEPKQLNAGESKQIEEEAGRKEELNNLLQKESRIPWKKVISLVVLEIGMLVLVVLKGGDDKSVVNVKCNSVVYWIIVGSIFPYLFTFVAIVSLFLSKEHKKKQELGYGYLSNDLKWNVKTIVIFCLVSVVVGIAAGFLGVGGGLLAAPVLLEMGVMPAVSVATSSFLILFTSSSTTAQFIVFGKLRWNYGLWFFGVGFLAAVLGQYVVAKLIQKYKKQAFISILLATLILVSLLTVTIDQSFVIAKHIKEHIPMGLKGICSGV